MGISENLKELNKLRANSKKNINKLIGTTQIDIIRNIEKNVENSWSKNKKEYYFFLCKELFEKKDYVKLFLAIQLIITLPNLTEKELELTKQYYLNCEEHFFNIMNKHSVDEINFLKLFLRKK